MYASIYDTQLDDVFDNINEHAMTDTEKLYHRDFGHGINDAYDINPIPIASGSIGQVYEAVDRYTGTWSR